LGVVIADVSGTGVGACLLMSDLSSTLKYEVRELKDLGELAARLSEHIFSCTKPESFISFFVGVLDRSMGELRYVNAGHNYPLLVDRAGEVKPLISTGMCLGMLPCETFETRAVTLGPGDVLCLFTDGIVECRNKGGEEFGEGRLIETLRDSSRLPARRVLDKVYEAVEAFSPGAEPDDDMTVVILKRSAA
jgi:sigma-B regulation protein RsbU (phosphoserine phosphatase)